MGLLVERLQSWGKAARGLEISRYAITQAPDPVRRSFVQGSLVDLPFPDGAFDAVVSVNVMEHLEPKDVGQALRECARVARRGLYHEITVLEDCTVIHRDPTHRTKLCAQAWLELMAQELPGWDPRRGFHVPRYKNGIFLLTRRG
jgi:SAM-dependent methyltransferase